MHWAAQAPPTASFSCCASVLPLRSAFFRRMATSASLRSSSASASVRLSDAQRDLPLFASLAWLSSRFVNARTPQTGTNAADICGATPLVGILVILLTAGDPWDFSVHLRHARICLLALLLVASGDDLLAISVWLPW